MDPLAIDRVSPMSAVQYAPGVAREPENQQYDLLRGMQQAGQAGRADSISSVECVTCANRSYQDQSDDPGVSMQSPTRLSPEEAAAAVMSHEREHQSREAGKTGEEGREVVSNDIQIFTSVCSECGRTYVSGGRTTTVTRAQEEQGEFAKQFFDEMLGGSRGEQIDEKV